MRGRGYLLQYLFYLLIILLPVQLGRHFWPSYSLVSGIRIDYLSPTVYLTDLIILFFIFLCLCFRLRSVIKNISPQTPKIFFLLFFLTVNILFSPNKQASLYTSVKLLEFLFLAVCLISLKPKLPPLLFPLSIALFFTSLIAIGQFLKQSSLSPLLWFLGERNFTASTPGIALSDLGGRLFLRPYATFPHPNVLGGFLSFGLTCLVYFFYQRRFSSQRLNLSFFYLTFCLSLVALFLTFSFSALLAFFFSLLLLFLSKLYLPKKSPFLTIASAFALLFFLILFFLKFNSLYFSQDLTLRWQLTQASLSLFLKSPIFGVGLNNFLPLLPQYLPTTSTRVYFWQPVHNAFLLILSEGGIVGLILFSYLICQAFIGSLRLYRQEIFLPLLLIFELLILAFFDHYLITLQQGQILLTLSLTLAFLPKNSYT